MGSRILTVAYLGRPADEVFAFVTTPRNWRRWRTSSLGVSGATEHPLGPGEQVTEEFMAAGRRGRVVWTVTAREAPHLWSVEARTAEGGSARLSYRLAPEAGGTRLEQELSYELPERWLRLLDRVALRRRLAREAGAAARRLEAVLR